MNNIMKLADEYADANRAYPSNVVEGVDRGDTRAALEAAVNQQAAEIENLKHQAQIWKSEAKAQKATVYEAYRVCTGGTGEPGDWNGSEPIRALAAERDALQAKLSAMESVKPVGYVSAGYLALGEGRISEIATDTYKVPVYTAPKVAQPLTDEQIEELYAIHVPIVTFEGFHDYARAIRNRKEPT